MFYTLTTQHISGFYLDCVCTSQCKRTCCLEPVYNLATLVKVLINGVTLFDFFFVN